MWIQTISNKKMIAGISIKFILTASHCRIITDPELSEWTSPRKWLNWKYYLRDCVCYRWPNQLCFINISIKFKSNWRTKCLTSLSKVSLGLHLPRSAVEIGTDSPKSKIVSRNVDRWGAEHEIPNELYDEIKAINLRTDKQTTSGNPEIGTVSWCQWHIHINLNTTNQKQIITWFS